eukprot:1149906-Pelagomonas_calceolata.AAC.3
MQPHSSTNTVESSTSTVDSSTNSLTSPTAATTQTSRHSPPASACVPSAAHALCRPPPLAAAAAPPCAGSAADAPLAARAAPPARQAASTVIQGTAVHASVCRQRSGGAAAGGSGGGAVLATGQQLAGGGVQQAWGDGLEAAQCAQGGGQGALLGVYSALPKTDGDRAPPAPLAPKQDLLEDKQRNGNPLYFEHMHPLQPKGKSVLAHNGLFQVELQRDMGDVPS